MLREKSKCSNIRMRVSMQGIGTEQSVVAMKLSKDSRAKGLCYPVLNVSQPAMGGTK